MHQVDSTMQHIVFRVDAAGMIGSGHVMRCLTLAEELRRHRVACRFICREHVGNLIHLIESRGFPVVRLATVNHNTAEVHEPVLDHADWLGTHWSQDAAETIDSLAGTIPDWLVVDHYAIDARWETQLKSHCRRLMVIDDLADRRHQCDLLLDQNLVADLETRYDGLLPAGCARLLGPEYALLQPIYGDLHPRTPPRLGPVQRILVYFGGADHQNLTGRTIEAFLRIQQPSVRLDVVVNSQGAQGEVIRQQIQGHDNIHLYGNLPSLAPLMVSADLAVGAGGATSWERLCLRLPAIVVTLAANQTATAKELHRRSLINWLGDFSNVDVQSIAMAIDQHLKKCNDRIAEENTENAEVDGLGAGRVADKLLMGNSGVPAARRACVSDAKKVVQLLKCQITYAAQRQASRFFGHIEWVYQVLRSPDDYLYVVHAHGTILHAVVYFKWVGDRFEVCCWQDPMTDDPQTKDRILTCAIRALRLEIAHGVTVAAAKWDVVTGLGESEIGNRKDSESRRLRIAICSDKTSWINEITAQLVAGWLAAGHVCSWEHDAAMLRSGDVCFYLSYGKIVKPAILEQFRNNVVVHASDLPRGRGWSPASWLILGGEDRIPVSLLEAEEKVDAGRIYDQVWIDLNRTDLVNDWRKKIAHATFILAKKFIDGYPDCLSHGRDQVGEPSYFPKRRPEDSELDLNEPLGKQINLLRIADNDAFPVFFKYGDEEFLLKVMRRETRKGRS